MFVSSRHRWANQVVHLQKLAHPDVRLGLDAEQDAQHTWGTGVLMCLTWMVYVDTLRSKSTKREKGNLLHR